MPMQFYVSHFKWIFDADTNTLYVSLDGYTCAVDPRTGRVRWEMAYGNEDDEQVVLLGPYLVMRSYGNLVICDAIRGGILANYEEDWDDRLALVDDEIRASVDSGAYQYVLKAPKLPWR